MYLKDSKFSRFKITVQDNCSTDDTIEVFQFFKSNYGSCFKNLSLISNLYNVGGSVNFLKAIELSQSKYTWVLCDDDVIDTSDIEDVLKVLEEDDFDLIHVGAHPEKERTIFQLKETPRKLIEMGYRYFAYSSFIPCNIFKTALFQNDFLIEGYKNVVNSYPHMPYLFNVFLEDKPIYVSKKQIVTARIEGQSYNMHEWLKWWINTSKMLSSKNNVRLAFFDQFKSLDDNLKIDYDSVFYFFNISELQNNKLQIDFRKDFFSLKEKIGFMLYNMEKKISYFRRILKKIKLLFEMNLK